MTPYAAHHNQPLRSRRSPDLDASPGSSPGTATPPIAGPSSPTSSTFLSSSVSSLWGGLVRRFSAEPSPTPGHLPHAHTFQPDGSGESIMHGDHHHGQGHGHGHSPLAVGNGIDGVYTPPRRTASPMLMRPPPLEPLQLAGFADETRAEARLLTPPIAEEIRIMVPARLGIADEWALVYSLEQDGASLATLYEKCARYQGRRVGFVLCVRDCEGGLFGAYLSDRPHPAPKYFGTGECFLWRASVLAPLPPPPSLIDDHPTGTAASRSTTIAAAPSTLSPTASTTATTTTTSRPHSPAATQSIRFKAFPYSGINEYYMLCDAHFLSLGAGGDGKFGLWLDDSLERGLSATSQTFGNEPLSDEGEKFGVLGVEVWVIGA